MTRLFRGGAEEEGRTGVPAYAGELDALRGVLAATNPGDVVALMCLAERDAVAEWILASGGRALTPADVRALAPAAAN